MVEPFHPKIRPLGDAQMEADHQTLLDLVAEVDALLAGAGDSARISAKLVTLYRLAEEHFSYEDTLMAAIPEKAYARHLALHQARHADFIRTVMAISARAKGFEPIDVLRRMYGGVLSSLVSEMVGLDAELLEILAELGRPGADGGTRTPTPEGNGF